MAKKRAIKGYTLDDEGYYVTKEIFRGRDFQRRCTQCGSWLFAIYAEKYSYFETVGLMMIMGLKAYGYECDVCNCCFIYNEQEED